MLIVAIFINFIVAAWLYPELYVNVDLRMVQGHETGGQMQYVFYLIGQFYQGGIQLFNRYDLLSTDYAQLSVGFYTPLNFLIAAGYVLLSPLSQDPAQFFHHWYILAYYGMGLMLRTFGTYILVRYMTKSRSTAVISTVLVNAFCAITLQHLGGLCISSVYNYLPMLLFCLVYYWQTRSFKAILASIAVFMLAANNSLYVGFGFFYQTVHLFLFDMLMIWLLFQRGRKPFLADKIDWHKAGALFVLVALILLPVFWWGHNVLGDFEMVSSGLGGSEGRFNRIYNPHAMMNDPLRYFVSTQDVFKHAYDFTVSGWYLNGVFLGITTMVLVVLGMVLGKHPYKVVFATAAVMMAFLNVPSTKGGWMMWAHWIDALTNPFCFLVRSFHYAVLLWYLSMTVPLCLGVQACIAIATKNYRTIYAGRINFLKGALAGIVGACIFIPDLNIKAYAFKILGLFLVFLVVFYQERFKLPMRIGLAIALFALIAVTEFSVLKSYINTPSVDMNGAYWDGLRVKPRIFNPMYTPPVPMVLDYQNPKILPVRFFYRTDAHVVFPLLVEFQGMFGQFYQYMPLALRLEREACIYVPRLKIFKDIHLNKEIQEYIKRDGRVMYMADAAIAPNTQHFASILEQGLDRRVIQIEDAYPDKVKSFQGLELSPALPERFKRTDYEFDKAKAIVRHKKEGIEYQWQLPKDFPRYLSTTVFTPDVQLWQLTAGNNQLVIAQGSLVYPGTYDVNNVRDGYLSVLMPGTMPLKDEPIVLHVTTPQALVDVWRNSQDQFGFTYQNPRDGWLVIHMPYNPKWQIFVDGKPTKLARVNGYFIGVPLNQGEHQLLLSYAPASPLRYLIIISTLVSLLTMFLIFKRVYRWSHE